MTRSPSQRASVSQPRARRRPGLRRPLAALLLAAALGTASLSTTGGAPAEAAYRLGGGLNEFYRNSGGEQGVYGQLQTAETRSTEVPGMVYAKTLNRRTGQWYWLTWTAAHGTIPVMTTGAIGARWERNLARSGAPASTEACEAGVCAQDFQDVEWMWSSTEGTHAVRAGFRAMHRAAAGVRGTLGAPTEEEHTVDGSPVQSFRDPATGRRTVLVWTREGGRAWRTAGAVDALYGRLGRVDGELGHPTSNEFTGLAGGGAWQAFSGGRIYWSPATGAQQILWGPILNHWTAQGSENGAWGYPASAARPVDGVWTQRFQHGVARQYQDGSVRYTPDRVEAQSPDQRMDEAARGAGMGSPVSGTAELQVSGTTVRYRTYSNGVVAHTDRYGAVPLSREVFDAWRAGASRGGGGQQNGFDVGLPVSFRDWATTFEGGRTLVLDQHDRLVERTDMAGGRGQALVIGDSQVWDGNDVAGCHGGCQGSWVVQSVRADGYRVDGLYRQGGIGFSQDNGAHYGSYSAGVLDNAWALPQAEPEVVYLQGSGNDVWNPAQTVRERTTATVQKLHAMYPSARIVLTGIISQTDQAQPGVAPRRNLTSVLFEDVARGTGTTFVPLAGKVTEWGVTSSLQDAVHFREGDGSQEKVAAHYAPYLKPYLG